mgnify:CR=1 FL=1|tara:strand:+ start:491 stop:1771 length:1281 start_codon:yes stop_codon:yes gene_type:complete
MEELFVKNRPQIKRELIEIEDNYKVLHFDEFPILYIGTNKFGNKIIGSHLEEDDDNQQIFTLHTILTNNEYYEFINGKKSYLNILKESNSICVVIKSFNFKIKNAYDVSFSDLPIEYLPLESSFCPKTVKNHSLSYSISLKGKLADMNKALAIEVSQIQNGFSDFIEDRIKSLKGFNAVPKALLQPYSLGSFRINLELDIQQKGKKTNMFFQLAKFDKFLSDYIQYLGTDFHIDKELFFDTEQNNNSEPLQYLEDSLTDLYDQAQIKKPENLSKLLKEDIQKSINKFEKITEEVGENFDSAEIININPELNQTLAFINRDFSENFQNAVQEIEISTKGIFEDINYNEYLIYIYHLNTDSRTGNAFIKNHNDDEKMSKPRIKIDGDESLETTKYTESLHLNKWIKVSAKARRTEDTFKYLNIQFEND